MIKCHCYKAVSLWSVYVRRVKYALGKVLSTRDQETIALVTETFSCGGLIDLSVVLQYEIVVGVFAFRRKTF